MRKNFGLLMGMYAMSVITSAQEHQEFMKDIEQSSQRKKRKEIDFSRKIEEVKPKGVKEYFFTENGIFSNTEIAKVELFFKCFALNDKNAIRKFNSYRKRHRGQ